MDRWATPRKLLKHKKLVIILAGALIVIALAVSLPLTLKTIARECTIDDIQGNQKFDSSVLEYIYESNLKSNDVMSLILYFNHKPTDEEILQIEGLGINISKSTWIPTGLESPVGAYGARANVEDICRLADIDSVVRVQSGESQPDFP